MFNTTIFLEAVNRTSDVYYSTGITEFFFIVYISCMAAILSQIFNLSLLPVAMINEIIGLPQIVMQVNSLLSQIYTVACLIPMGLSTLPLDTYIYVVHGQDSLKRCLNDAIDLTPYIHYGFYWYFTIAALIIIKASVSILISVYHYNGIYKLILSNLSRNISDLFLNITEISMLDFFSELFYTIYVTYSMIVICSWHHQVTLIKTIFTFKGLNNSIALRAAECDIKLTFYLLEAYPKQE